MVATDHGGYRGELAGVGRDISYLLPHIDQRRFRVVLVVLRDDGGLADFFRNSAVKVYRLGRRKFDPRTLLDFLHIIRQENVHIMHLFQYASASFGGLAGYISAIPVILNVNDLNYNYPWYQRIVDRLLRFATDHVIAVSEAAKQSCVRMRGFAPDKIEVMPSGIPQKRLRQPDTLRCQALREKWQIPSSAKVIGSVTRLIDIKGNDVVIRAAVQVLAHRPHCVFVLVGSGPEEAALRKLSKHLGIDEKIIFTGFQHNVMDWLGLFDIKIIASDTEGNCLALQEAMVMGKPIVTTAVGGIVELVEEGKSGLLVPARDPATMAQKILYLLDNDAICKKLANNAARTIRSVDVEHCANLRMQTYARLVSLNEKG
jgi:glycosyltransferase involved in cell wall biosynthesis